MNRINRMSRAFADVSWAVLLLGVGCVNRGQTPPQSTPILCNMTRSECTGEFLGDQTQCKAFEDKTFTATTCTKFFQTQQQRTDSCRQAFCDRAQANPLVRYDYPVCTVNTADLGDPITLPAVGACQVAGSGTGRSTVDYRLRSRPCTEEEGGVCDPLNETIVVSQPPPDNCKDLSIVSANDLIQTASGDHDRSAQLLRVVLNDSRCAPTNAFRSSFDFTAGPVGQAAGAGTTVPLSATRGFAVMSRSCATCTFNKLDNLRVNLGNMTIAGSQLTNVVVATSAVTPLLPPDSSGRNIIAAHQLKLAVVGQLNGVPSVYLAENQDQWLVGPAGPGFRLQGTINVVNADQGGQQLGVSVAINAPGAPSTTQSTACSGATPRDRLFGFEDPQSWSSTNASLSLVTSPVTQGCGALGVAGQNFLEIAGAPSTTSGLTVKPALSVDLFIPNNQPNQFFLGNLQILLSCPSGGVNNQFIGQLGLTGKPQNQFSTLRFPLPSQTVSTLQRPLNDCFFTLGLNVNQTNRTWILDNARFTP